MTKLSCVQLELIRKAADKLSLQTTRTDDPAAIGKTLRELVTLGMAHCPPCSALDLDEIELKLASGYSLASGVYDPTSPTALMSGEYVRLLDPDGHEVLYWDQTEWEIDPALVMGAIINAAIRLPLENET